MGKNCDRQINRRIQRSSSQERRRSEGLFLRLQLCYREDELHAVQTVNYDGIIAKEMVPVRTYMYSGYVREERTGKTYRLYVNPLEQAKKDFANKDF